jgi:hypothetical protein
MERQSAAPARWGEILVVGPMDCAPTGAAKCGAAQETGLPIKLINLPARRRIWIRRNRGLGANLPRVTSAQPGHHQNVGVVAGTPLATRGSMSSNFRHSTWPSNMARLPPDGNLPFKCEVRCG